MAIVFTWWSGLSPTEAGAWDLEYARPAEAALEDGLVHVYNVRDFRYRSRNDRIPSWYDAIYDPADLSGIDLICSYWSGSMIAHVFLSFAFGDGRHLAVSVETRRRPQQRYHALAGFFRSYQLAFVVADERDLIGVRTDIRREAVYVYPLRTEWDERQRLFRGIVTRASTLVQQPEFYNTLTNNCTTNIVALINAGLPPGQRLRWNWRLVLSGHADRFAYRIGRIDTALPFESLKRCSRVIRDESRSIAADFPDRIRSTRVARDHRCAGLHSARSGRSASRW